MSDMEWEDTGPVLLRASRLRCSATATGNDMSGLEDNAKHVGNCSRLKGGREMEKAGTDQHDDNERPSKRRKHCAEAHTSTVRVIYQNLTRESRKKLHAVLKQWSEWCGHGAGASEEEFAENGDDLFFPALKVGQSTSTSVPVWIDRPLRKGGKEQALGGLSLSSSKEREAEIPLYDRICNPVSARDSPVRPEGLLELPREALRCFNCGSYSHGLKDCPRPRDNAVINNARKLKVLASGGSRPAARYYQSPGVKFDGMKPGFLSKEARLCLGIGEWDPPPWHSRMLQMGYPPGYLEDEDVPSGMVIFGAEESVAEDAGPPEDGEILQGVTKQTINPGEQPWLSPSEFTSKPWGATTTKKMVVKYAGLNAPLPEMADKRLWAAPSSLQVPGMQMTPFLQHSVSAPSPVLADGTARPGYPSARYDSPSQMYGQFSSRGLPLSPTPLLPSPTREYSPIRTQSGYMATGGCGGHYEHYTTAHSLLAVERLSSPGLDSSPWARPSSNLLASYPRSRPTEYHSS